MEATEFFEACSELSLTTNTQIAKSFNVSSQTIRNWKKTEVVPTWVTYALISVQKNLDCEEFGFTEFKNWQRRNNITTYEQTGNIFGIKRQAVHQWFRRGRFPSWLCLACIGWEHNT